MAQTTQQTARPAKEILDGGGEVWRAGLDYLLKNEDIWNAEWGRWVIRPTIDNRFC
jgi:hypothetical protein